MNYEARDDGVYRPADTLQTSHYKADNRLRMINLVEGSDGTICSDHHRGDLQSDNYSSVAINVSMTHPKLSADANTTTGSRVVVGQDQRYKMAYGPLETEVLRSQFEREKMPVLDVSMAQPSITTSTSRETGVLRKQLVEKALMVPNVSAAR